MPGASHPAPSGLAGLVVIVVVMDAPQVGLVDGRRDLSSQLCACLLVESEMNAAIHAGVVDVRGDLLEFLILKHDSRNRRIRHRDGMTAGAVETPEHLSTAIASACVIRSVTGEARCRDERRPRRGGGGFPVVIQSATVDARLRPP